MKYRSIILVAVAALVLCIASAAHAFDYRSYGRWLDTNMVTEFAFNSSNGSVRFDRGYPETTIQIRNILGPGVTFEGGVYGVTTKADGTRERDEGTVTMTFGTRRAGRVTSTSDHGRYSFTADFEGIDALMDIRDGSTSDFWSNGKHYSMGTMHQSGSAFRTETDGVYERRISLTGWGYEKGHNQDGSREYARMYMRAGAHGDAIAGTVFGSRRTYGYAGPNNTNYYYGQETFSGVFEATEN